MFHTIQPRILVGQTFVAQVVFELIAFQVVVAFRIGGVSTGM